MTILLDLERGLGLGVLIRAVIVSFSQNKRGEKAASDALQTAEQTHFTAPRARVLYLHVACVWRGCAGERSVRYLSRNAVLG